MYDAIVIGAGLSGLAAGIRLAHFDRSVCILERHTTIGGLNSFYRQGGRNYDVGLHAMTNYAPKGARGGPLSRLLRQLRFGWDEFALSPQRHSAIRFPGVQLRFSNDVELLESEIRRVFPGEIDGWRRLLADVADYDDLDRLADDSSARDVVAQRIGEPLLREMLFAPLMFYGSARERDMDFGQFSIMFRSIFLEGLARPWAGIRLILKKLVRKFRELGGELKLRAGVERLEVDRGRVLAVVLEDGTRLEARQVVSSAGWLETMRLCDDASRAEPRPAGQLSFVEALVVLDRQPRELGCDETIVFFNDCDEFHWEKPNELCDLRSGVICSPNNFVYDEPLAEGMIRVTALANHQRWSELPPEDYRLAKLRWFDRLTASAVRFVPDFRGAVIDDDMFTPTTVRRFTGHVNGAIYGAPRKQFDGRTHLDNLFICGTDQGMLGIVGSMLSGITIANKYFLQPTTATTAG